MIACCDFRLGQSIAEQDFRGAIVGRRVKTADAELECARDYGSRWERVWVQDMVIAKPGAAKNDLRDERGERREHCARGGDDENQQYVEYLIRAESVHLNPCLDVLVRLLDRRRPEPNPHFAPVAARVVPAPVACNCEHYGFDTAPLLPFLARALFFLRFVVGRRRRHLRRREAASSFFVVNANLITRPNHSQWVQTRFPRHKPLPSFARSAATSSSRRTIPFLFLVTTKCWRRFFTLECVTVVSGQRPLPTNHARKAELHA